MIEELRNVFNNNQYVKSLLEETNKPQSERKKYKEAEKRKRGDALYVSSHNEANSTFFEVEEFIFNEKDNNKTLHYINFSKEIKTNNIFYYSFYLSEKDDLLLSIEVVSPFGSLFLTFDKNFLLEYDKYFSKNCEKNKTTFAIQEMFYKFNQINNPEINKHLFNYLVYNITISEETKELIQLSTDINMSYLDNIDCGYDFRKDMISKNNKTLTLKSK